MPGRIPSSGAISFSTVSAREGYPATQRMDMNNILMRAFCGRRAVNSSISLGDARGNQVTVIGTLSRSNYASSVTMPSVSLSSYFDAGQYASGYPLYTTVNVDVPPTWWASQNNPRNMTSTLGRGNNATGGGTGGKKTSTLHKVTMVHQLLVVVVTTVGKAQAILTDKLPCNTLV